MSSFVLEIPLCNLHPSIINSVLCVQIVQRAYLASVNRNKPVLPDGVSLLITFTSIS